MYIHVPSKQLTLLIVISLALVYPMFDDCILIKDVT